jgi:predicted DNA-binding protein YlxM (UPF0122 family)
VKKFRPYFTFLSVKYNNKKEIVTDNIKFYLDQIDQWEDQLNLVTTNEFAKQQFWKSVKQELSKI